MSYMKNPMGIEDRSMEIIDEQLKSNSWSLDELKIVRRMIHTTGDFDYQDIIKIENDFVNKAKEALLNNKYIYTDTKMAMAGINKGSLAKLNLELKNYIDDEKVKVMSKELKTTRSQITIDRAIEDGCKIFVIGNAPTALYRLMEKMDEGFVPDFIVGVPVGFVGARESKVDLTKYNVPYVTTISNKGGSNVAASVINALLYMLVDRGVK